MFQCLSAHLSRQNLLCRSRVAQCGASFLVLSFVLLAYESISTARRLLHHKVNAHDCGFLKGRCTSIEYEHRPDAIEQQFRYPSEKSKNMSVHERSAVFVTHSSLKLIQPDARVDCHLLSLHVLKPSRYNRIRGLAWSLQLGYKKLGAHWTGRPTGARRVHRPATPMLGPALCWFRLERNF